MCSSWCVVENVKYLLGTFSFCIPVAQRCLVHSERIRSAVWSSFFERLETQHSLWRSHVAVLDRRGNHHAPCPLVHLLHLLWWQHVSRTRETLRALQEKETRVVWQPREQETTIACRFVVYEYEILQYQIIFNYIPQFIKPSDFYHLHFAQTKGFLSLLLFLGPQTSFSLSGFGGSRAPASSLK